LILLDGVEPIVSETAVPTRLTGQFAESAAAWRWVLASVCLAVPLVPLLAVLVIAAGHSTAWDHVSAMLLPEYARNTALLVCLGGGLAVIIGTVCAWLVTAIEFPGRRIVSWALVLPFALPSYIAAYAWGDMLGVRGLWVAVLVFATTLYPYAYLTARAGFAAQSVCALEAARSLGAGPMQRFFDVALPMARAAIVAGAALIGLEIMADYGAADYLGVPTLAVGVFRTWFSLGDLAGAARIAVAALSVALILLWIERRARRGEVSGGSIRWRTATPAVSKPIVGIMVLAVCTLPLLLGLILPVSHLASRALEAGPPLRTLAEPALATAMAALAGASATLLLALTAAAINRLHRTNFAGRSGFSLGQSLHLSMMAGYATPGAVLALGILSVLALSGGEAAAALTGSAGLLVMVLAFAGRFGGAAFEPIEAGLAKTTPSMRNAAASLGADATRRFLKVEAPIALPSVFAAALIVAVEIAKELPATLILRPFGFDTLAVRAHAYASDERLASAAWPALIIVGLALVPTMLLTGAIEKARAGAKG
jgi:iron(III) transport system permease protein